MEPSRMKIRQILCPTDYSDFSERALEQAVRIARWFGAGVTVVHVVAPIPWAATPDTAPYITLPADLLRTHRQDEAEALERFVAPQRGKGVTIHTRLLDGDTSRVIQATVLELPADLVVMGTHGRGGFEHLVLGSVAEKVLRRATCPVLTVGNTTPIAAGGPPFLRILCAVDLTPGSERTIDMALSLAEEDGARVTLLHVLEGVPGWAGPPRYRALPQVVKMRKELFHDAEDRLRRAVPADARELVAVSERLEEGIPWHEVLRVAEAEDADVIVLGAHSRGALEQAFFGSTVNHIVREARRPVLVVRGTSTRLEARDEAPAGDTATSLPGENRRPGPTAQELRLL